MTNMHSKTSIIENILKNKNKQVLKKQVNVFAPSNIALCKYWGKRDLALNLPTESSLSIALNNYGVHATLQMISTDQHQIIINDKDLSAQKNIATPLENFLNFFRFSNTYAFCLQLKFNIPVAAGLASSACTYAAIVLALNDLYQWQLETKYLSILARLGSGSACRSIYSGFVEWHHGQRDDGMDSYAEPLSATWPELRIGLCIISQKEKSVSSREGMKRTVETSPLYAQWPNQVKKDLTLLKESIAHKDFDLFGRTAEHNALVMHATMLAAQPPLLYSIPETIAIMHRIWDLRYTKQISLYFTQDAGPNLKLLFLQSDLEKITQAFEGLMVVKPFIL